MGQQAFLPGDDGLGGVGKGVDHRVDDDEGAVPVGVDEDTGVDGDAAELDPGTEATAERAAGRGRGGRRPVRRGDRRHRARHPRVAGGGRVGVALLTVGAAAMGSFAWWLVRRKRRGEPALLEPELFASAGFRFGVSGLLLQQVALGGTMIALPIFLQMVLEYDAMASGLSPAPLSLSMFAVALAAGKRAGGRRPAAIIRAGFAPVALGPDRAHPDRAASRSGGYLVVPLLLAGSGLGLLVSQLDNYTLGPIPGERVSEAAGVNSAAVVRPLVRPGLCRRPGAPG